MANTLLLSGSTRFTAIHRPVVDSLHIHCRKSNPPLSPPPSFTLRFAPLLPPYSVKVKCSAKPPLQPKPKSDIRSEDPDPIWAVVDSILNTLKKPARVLVVVLTSVLLMTHPLSSLAASGGRMGGRCSSPSSSSSGSSWKSYSSSSDSSKPSYSYSSKPSYSYSSDSDFDSSYSSSSSSSALESMMMCAVILILIRCLLYGGTSISIDSQEKTRVFKLQVGLLGTAKSLQSELNGIAETADTSTRKGLHCILTETTVALLRHPDSFISAYASADAKSDTKDWEKWLNQSSIEERAKFDEETLVNVDNKRTQRPTTRITDGFNNEYIVVTILVVAEGQHVLPTIKESKDLKAALQMLGSIPSSHIKGVEVMWTPQAENDTLSEEELHEDYPLLRPL